MRQHIGTLVLLVAIIGGLSVDVRSHSRSRLEESQLFQRSSEIMRYQMNAADGMSRARLRVVLKMEAGRVDWTLTDPSGREIFAGSGTRGRNVGDTGNLDPIPGTWTLELRLQDATGEFNVDWNAN
jgi:hypothetical protein